MLRAAQEARAPEAGGASGGRARRAARSPRLEKSLRRLAAVDDLRHAARRLRGQPAFTGVAIATLAPGIGSGSAIFSVVEAFLLRALPYREPASLVSVRCELARIGRTNVGTSVPEFEDMRDRAGLFDDLSIVFPMHGNLTGVDRPQRVEAMAVGSSFFRLLGAPPLLG